MSIKASASVTLSSYRDTEAITRYYKLVSSTASAPSKPTTNPPSGWDDTEPSYTSGSTNTLYFCDLTEFSDGTWAYSAVSKSSSYEAAKEAYNKAQNAQDTANSANGKIDNLEVGGRNLLVGTNQGTSKWSNSHKNGTYGIEEVDWNGIRAVKMTCTTAATGWKMFTFDGLLYNFDKLEPGGTYTLSYDVAGEISVGFSDLMDRSGSNRLANNSTLIKRDTTNYGFHYEYRIILKDALVKSSQVVYFTNNLTDNTEVIIANLKLEKGNKATDWTPAPEDTETKIESVSNDIAQANADIEILNGRITSTASEVSALGTRTSTLEQTASDFTVRFTNDEKDIKDAAKVATNYLNFNGSGLTIGNLTDTTLGNNVFIDSDSVDIRSGTTVLASYQANKVELGKNSRNSVIDLCNGLLTIQYGTIAEDRYGGKLISDSPIWIGSSDSTMLNVTNDNGNGIFGNAVISAQAYNGSEGCTGMIDLQTMKSVGGVAYTSAIRMHELNISIESIGANSLSGIYLEESGLSISTTKTIDGEGFDAWIELNKSTLFGESFGNGYINMVSKKGINIHAVSEPNIVFHYSDDSVIFRNDGSDFYILHGSSDSPASAWDTLRPFSFNFETGKVTIGNDLTVGGNIVTTGTLNFTQYSKGFSCTTTFGHTGIVTVSSGEGLYLYTYKTGVSGWDSSLCLANANGVNLVPKTGGGFSGNISAPIMYATNRIEAGRVLSKGTYTNTTTGAANVAITSGHYLVRSTSSSERYKHDINPISQYRDILNIPVKEYIYNLDYVSEDDQRYNKVIPGFIAEDVERFYPIAAEYANGLVEDWNHRMILPPMLAVLEDHDKEIQDMRKEISNLEAIIEQSGIKINGCS